MKIDEVLIFEPGQVFRPPAGYCRIHVKAVIDDKFIVFQKYIHGHKAHPAVYTFRLFQQTYAGFTLCRKNYLTEKYYYNDPRI